jgi:transglutaminase-like putative cysteine protease
MRSSLIDKGVLDENEPKQRRQSGRSPYFQPTTLSQPSPALRFTQLGQDVERRSTFLPQEGWSPLILLAIAIYCVVIVIVQANWVTHSEFFYIFPIVGILVGFLVAKIPMVPQVFLHVLACFIGYMLAEWSSMLAFHTSWIVEMGMESATLSEIVFFFYLSFLCFFLGYFGSWLIYRARLPWLVTLVYGSIMLVNLNYVTSEFNVLLLVMLGALILLIARMQLSLQLLQWASEGLYTDKTWLRKITWRCMQFACILTLITMLLSWFLPMQAQPSSGKVLWNNINAAWTSAITGRFPWTSGNYFTSSGGDATNYFGDQLTISSSVHLPAGEVLSYKSSDGKSHYLENATFDSFDGTSWTISDTDMTANDYPSDSILPSDVSAPSETKITTDVTMDQSIPGSKNYLFAPAQPLAFNVPTQVSSSGNDIASTATSWADTDPLSANESYSVYSALPSTASLTSVPLPANNMNYWMSDPYYSSFSHAYLQRPSDLTPAVEKTLFSWINGDTNAYDALKSIESHFSSSGEFKYSVDNKAIPANTDVVDWLLQTHVGYCTYYASAMAIMGRFLQIPTRLVTGFSGGSYNASRNVWSVQGSDAHSWVQAYFPGHGWINFDPTPGFSTTSNSSANVSQTPVATTPAVKPTVTPKPQPTSIAHAQPTPVDTQKQGPSQATNSISLSLWGALGLLFLSLLFFICILVFRQRQRRNASRSIISGMYWRACRVAGWVGLGPKSWQTPYEYTSMLSRHWPAEGATLWHLTDLYVRERWGGSSSPQEYETTAIEHTVPSIQSLFWHLLLRKKKK